MGLPEGGHIVAGVTGSHANQLDHVTRTRITQRADGFGYSVVHRDVLFRRNTQAILETVGAQ